MISPSSTSPRVTAEGGPYVFRVCFIDPFQGLVMAKFARGSLGLTRVAVLTDAKSAYSQGLAHVFTERFTALGGQIVADEAYGKGDTDFRAQLTRIKARRPDGLFIPGYYSDVGPIARQTRELGLSTQLFGGDGWDSGDKLAELGGAAIEGALYSTHFAPDNPSPRVHAFRERFKARFQAAPDALAALGYDAARVGIDAMRRAAVPRGAALRDALAATRDFDGVTGRITFDAERNPVKSAVVVRMTEGRARFLAEVAP